MAELVRRQTEVVNQLLAEAEQLLANDKTRTEAGLKLYQAQLGMPKNKKLLKLLNETGRQAAGPAGRARRYLADRKLPIKQQEMRDLEDTLYFVLDEKGHSVHLTDRGAAAMSPDDPTLFLVPDISEAIHEIENDPDLDPTERREPRRKSSPTTRPRARSSTSSTSCSRPTRCTRRTSTTSCRTARS